MWYLLSILGILYLIVQLLVRLNNGVGVFRGILIFSAIMLGSYAWQQFQDGRDKYYNAFESTYGLHHDEIVEIGKKYDDEELWDEWRIKTASELGISMELLRHYEDKVIDNILDDMLDEWTYNEWDLMTAPEGASIEGYNEFARMREKFHDDFKSDEVLVKQELVELKYESNLDAWKRSMEDNETLMLIYWTFSMLAISYVYEFVTVNITLKRIIMGLTRLGVFFIIFAPIMMVVFPGFFQIQDDYLGANYFRTCWNLWELWTPICMVAVVAVLSTMGFYEND